MTIDELKKWCKLYLPELNDIQLNKLLIKAEEYKDSAIEDALWHERIGNE